MMEDKKIRFEDLEKVSGGLVEDYEKYIDKMMEKYDVKTREELAPRMTSEEVATAVHKLISLPDDN